MSETAAVGYVVASDVIWASVGRHRSVSDYIENIYGVPGLASSVVDNFVRLGALNPSTDTVCEIGTGAGLYAKGVLKYKRYSQYESYEASKGWANWLSRSYKIVSHSAEKYNLSSTPAASVDFVHANGVFVHTAFLVTIRYFVEMFRVTKSGGYCAFNLFSERCFHAEALKSWIASGCLYPTILPQEYVKRLFAANGFEAVGEFFSKVPGKTPHSPGWSELESHYLVFKKT